jgi:hypothetical protein
MADKRHPQQRFQAAKEVLERDRRIGPATQRQDEGEMGLPSMTWEEFEAIYRKRKVTALES